MTSSRIDVLTAASVTENRPRAFNRGVAVVIMELDKPRARVAVVGRCRSAFERTRATTEWPFARASRTISRPVPPVAPKQEPSCSISILIGVNVAVHAVTAFWAAAKTSCADVEPATCSVPSTPRSIHPAFTASYISSAGAVSALRDADLLERFRPPCTRDCKGFHVEIQDFTQLLRDFIRGDHRTKLDDALP